MVYESKKKWTFSEPFQASSSNEKPNLLFLKSYHVTFFVNVNYASQRLRIKSSIIHSQHELVQIQQQKH